MRRVGFTLLEVLLALLLLTVGVMGALAAQHHALIAERRAQAARRARDLERQRLERHAADRWRAMRRAGFGLTEVLVSLVIGAMVVATAAAHLGPARAAALRREAQRTAMHVATDAAMTVALELRELWQPVALGDTALEGGRIIGGGLTCAPGVIPDTSDAVWRATPRAGDTWWEWTGTAWQSARITRMGRTRCPDGQPAWRADAATAAPAWTPVRVVRVGRWVVYRDADDAMHLGLREANGTRWDAIQPVVGPATAMRLVTFVTDTGARVQVTAWVGGAVHAAEQWVLPRNP